eukprot:Hpha_TRINITY_DN16646_c0_g3::TRINITY_DN16646_c0_g3_i1::g.179516::m.179516
MAGRTQDGRMPHGAPPKGGAGESLISGGGFQRAQRRLKGRSKQTSKEEPAPHPALHRQVQEEEQLWVQQPATSACPTFAPPPAHTLPPCSNQSQPQPQPHTPLGNGRVAQGDPPVPLPSPHPSYPPPPGLLTPHQQQGSIPTLSEYTPPTGTPTMQLSGMYDAACASPKPPSTYPNPGVPARYTTPHLHGGSSPIQNHGSPAQQVFQRGGYGIAPPARMHVQQPSVSQQHEVSTPVHSAAVPPSFSSPQVGNSPAVQSSLPKSQVHKSPSARSSTHIDFSKPLGGLADWGRGVPQGAPWQPYATARGPAGGGENRLPTPAVQSGSRGEL